MPYAIELYLDDESISKIDKIRSEFKKNKINIDEGTEPHVTLSIYKDLPLDDFENKLKIFAKEIQSFKIIYSSVGIFTNDNPVIFLAPVVTSKLLDVHKKFHNYFKEYNDIAWDYYKPNQWVPHSTLCMNLSEEILKKSTGIISNIKLPIETIIEKIGILEFSPNKALNQFKLG